MSHRNPAIFISLFLLGSGLLFGQTTYAPDKEGFIRDWLAAGPFPNEPQADNSLSAGFNQDFLAPLGGEANACPYAGAMIKDVLFFADKGKLVAKIGATNAWGYTESKTINIAFKKLHVKEASPIAILNNLHPDFQDYYVAYLAAYVHSPADQAVQVRLGSDDGFKLWLNGRELGHLAMCRGWEVDQNVFNAALKKGWNRILFKIMDLTGDCGGMLRIVDAAGKPVPGLKVATELPEQRFRTICRNIGQIDAAADGLFARIDLGPAPYFVGPAALDFRLGYQAPLRAKVDLAINGPNARTVWTLGQTRDLRTEQAWEVKQTILLTVPGAYVLTAKVTDLQGKLVGTLEKSFDVIGADQLKSDQRQLAEKVRRLAAAAKDQTAFLDRLKTTLAARKAAVARQYERMEKQYAEARQKQIDTYGPAAQSIDIPFAPARGLRSRLCINGDLWEIAAAKSTGRSSVDETYIPTAGWEPITVPTFGVEYYFRGWFGWPMKGGPYEPAKTAVNTDAACGWMPNEGRENNAMYLRTKFTLPKDWNGRRLLLSADMIQYKVKIWVNGQLASEGFYGWVVPLEVDLTKFAKPGENTLMLYCGRAWLYPGGYGASQETWGPYGDVYLKSVPSVYVSDAWVISHWRQATIETRTSITNTAGEPRTVTLNQKAVLGGRISRDLGDMPVTVPAHSTLEVKRTNPWSDPQPWGIGGPYGRPVMYHLVSTIIENGKPVDQHFQRFGYREFWKSKFDYWLNGKRFFVQGDVGYSTQTGSRHIYHTLFTLTRNLSNINTIRGHDDLRQGAVPAEVCDELGMLYYANMYPILALPEPKDNATDDLAWFLKTPQHKENVRRYTAWVKWLRNHPSIAFYSTDNEVFTQANGKPWTNSIRTDRLADYYERFVKQLDPTRIVTRDGDQGTWGPKLGAWAPKIPSEVGNYHYPEFDSLNAIHNWQSTYDKPVVYGETMYHSYGAWDQCVGAKPSQVAMKANKIRSFMGLYRELEVSGWIGMGVGADGFVVWEGGASGPLATAQTPFRTVPVPKPGEAIQWYREGKLWPGCRLRYPAQSGIGYKLEFGTGPSSIEGHRNINWFIPGYPVCIPNEVNRAYKESTWPMPEAPKTRAPEVIYQIVKNGKPLPGAMVFLTPLSGQATEPVGIWADRKGKAWFTLHEPGEYQLTVEGTDYRRTVKVDLLPNDLKPGLNYMPQVKVEIK
jgi:hypothetical protein